MAPRGHHARVPLRSIGRPVGDSGRGGRPRRLPRRPDGVVHQRGRHTRRRRGASPATPLHPAFFSSKGKICVDGDAQVVRPAPTSALPTGRRRALRRVFRSRAQWRTAPGARRRTGGVRMPTASSVGGACSSPARRRPQPGRGPPGVEEPVTEGVPMRGRPSGVVGVAVQCSQPGRGVGDRWARPAERPERWSWGDDGVVVAWDPDGARLELTGGFRQRRSRRPSQLHGPRSLVVVLRAGAQPLRPVAGATHPWRVRVRTRDRSGVLDVHTRQSDRQDRFTLEITCWRLTAPASGTPYRPNHAGIYRVCAPRSTTSARATGPPRGRARRPAPVTVDLEDGRPDAGSHFP